MNKQNIRLEIIKAFDECHALFKHAEETYILKKDDKTIQRLYNDFMISWNKDEGCSPEIFIQFEGFAEECICESCFQEDFETVEEFGLYVDYLKKMGEIK